MRVRNTAVPGTRGIFCVVKLLEELGNGHQIRTYQRGNGCGAAVPDDHDGKDGGGQQQRNVTAFEHLHGVRGEETCINTHSGPGYGAASQQAPAPDVAHRHEEQDRNVMSMVSDTAMP